MSVLTNGYIETRKTPIRLNTKNSAMLPFIRLIAGVRIRENNKLQCFGNANVATPRKIFYFRVLPAGAWAEKKLCTFPESCF